MRLIKNVLSNLARGAAGAVVALLLPALLVRHMSALSFAVWSLVLQLAAYVGYLDFGLQTAIGRYVAYANERRDPEGRDSIVSTAFAALCGAGALSILFIGLAAAFANRLFPHVPSEMLPSIRWALSIVGICMALGLPASSWNGVFIGLQRNEIPAFTVGGAKLLSAGVIAAVALKSPSLISMALAMGTVNLVSYAVQYWLLRVLAPEIRLRWALVRKSAFRELGGYCLSLTTWSFAMMLVNGLDLLLVGRFEFGLVAGYAVASSLVTFVAGVQSAIFTAMMPKAAILHAQDKVDALGRLLLTSTRVGVLLLIVSGVPLLLYASPILRVWVGPAYVQQASSILPVLLAGNMIRLLWVPYGVVLVGSGQQRLVLAGPLAEGVTNVLTSVIFGLKFGAIGVAYGTVMGALVGSLANFLYSMPRTSEQIGLSRRGFVTSGVALPSLAALPLLALVQLYDRAYVSGVTAIALALSMVLAALMISRRDRPDKLAQISVTLDGSRALESQST